MSERIPSVEYFVNILDAAGALWRSAQESSFVNDVPELPGFERGAAGFKVAFAAVRLEDAMNPGRLPFGNSQRVSMGVQNWQDAMKLVGAWRGLRIVHDQILKDWKLLPACEGK
jgi:hypothetical protein